MVETKVVYQKVPNGRSEVEESKAMPPGMTAIRIILWMVVKAANVLFLPFYLTRKFKKPKRCPPIQNKILLIPATDLAKKIRTGEITSENVVQAYVSRVKEVNPVINAVIQDRFEAALEEAREVDKIISSKSMTEEEMEREKPLFGIPITVKGSIAVAKMKDTSGSIHRKDIVAKKDAVPVRLARQAGAIPILVSNIPELCMNWESTNKLVGTTKNPHDTTRTSGGSSGGEASLLATAGSLIGIGSDVAGSLRLPAHFCGVYGHKPTPGVVSFEGHYPSCKQKDVWKMVFTLGPMSRYAKDLRLLLGVITEPEMREMLDIERPVEIKTLKIYYMDHIDSTLTGKVTQECLAALHDVVKHFDKVCNVKCTKVCMPQMKYVPETASLALLDIDEVDNFFPGHGDGAVKEIFKYMLRRSNTTVNCILYGLLRRLTDYIPRTTTEGCKQRMDELRQTFVDMLGEDGVFLFPTFTSEAHYHGEIYRKLFDSAYLSIFNSIGLPVTNCPVKMSKEGLPIGIQVVAAPFFDRLSLAASEEIERAFGGWQAPPSKAKEEMLETLFETRPNGN